MFSITKQTVAENDFLIRKITFFCKNSLQEKIRKVIDRMVQVVEFDRNKNDELLLLECFKRSEAHSLTGPPLIFLKKEESSICAVLTFGKRTGNISSLQNDHMISQ